MMVIRFSCGYLWLASRQSTLLNLLKNTIGVSETLQVQQFPHERHPCAIC